MKILILGGDGFCGWPTALELSKSGYQVHILDNFSRRNIDISNNTNSLTPITSIENRIKIWKEITDKNIGFCFIDLKTQYKRLVEYIYSFEPDAIIHFAEQRSAPYSMKNSETKRFTIDNNITVTSNILNAITSVNRKIHLIHLGTMGVYGYDNNVKINEGYINVDLGNGKNKIKKQILFPFDPGSIYHLSKCLDSQMFQYFSKAFGLKITDLHQGIVWGTQTSNTLLHEHLINRFDYDSDYGTVINRFLVQSVIDFPLTLYGTGNQQRAFININDSINFIKQQVESTSKYSNVNIINQMTEIKKISDIANIVKNYRMGVCVQHLDNPRKEIENNTLDVNNSTILKHVKPKLIETCVFDELRLIEKYKNNIKVDSINPKSFW